MLAAESIASIVAMPIARSPIQHMNADPLPTLISTVTSLHNLSHNIKLQLVAACACATNPLWTGPLPVTLDGGLIDAGVVSLEQALFPYLFPLGVGHWGGKQNIGSVLPPALHAALLWLHSVQQLLAALLKMLLIFHVRQASLLARACSEQVLQRHIRSYTFASPHATEEDAVQHVLKHNVPAAVPGSLQYFKQQLLDLVAMIEC